MDDAEFELELERRALKETNGWLAGPSDPTHIPVEVGRLEELKASEKKLSLLEAWGVDNWEHYDGAMQALYEEF